MRMPKSGRVFLPIGTTLGFVAVLAAALISHRALSDLGPRATYLFQLAIIFHLGHALVLMVIGMLSAQFAGRLQKLLILAGGAFTIGIVVFCGSLYWLSVFGSESLGGLSFITPLGGAAFFIGWLALCLVSFRVISSDIGRGSK